MKYSISFLFFIICFLFSTFSLKADVYSFEGTSYSPWIASNSTLTLSKEKVKLGTQSLKWVWNKNATLTLPNNSDITEVSAKSGSGFGLWIYNTKAVQSKLTISVLNNTQSKASIPIHLNFTGWRYILVAFEADMGMSKSDRGTINALKISAPTSNSGTLYFDYLEFFTSVNWERMSDFQYTVSEAVGIDSYIDCYNQLSIPSITPTAKQKEGITTISNRLDQWLMGSSEHLTNEFYALRQQNLLSYIQSAVKKVPSIAENGTVNGSGLFSQKNDGKTVDGISLYTFRKISESYLIPLAYDYRINGNQSSLDKLFEIYDWYQDQGWDEGSSIGTLRKEMLRAAGFHYSMMIVKDQLGSRKDYLLRAQAWHARMGDICGSFEQPGDLADYIRTVSIPKLFNALEQDSPELKNGALTAFVNYMNNALRTAYGYLGSMKPDGSGYHHHGPYYSAYYPDVLYAGAMTYYLLHDTPYALNNESFENLKKGLLTFRFFCAQYNVPAGTVGRFPTQTQVLQSLIPAFAYLIECSDDADLKKAYKRLWQPDNELFTEMIKRAKTDITFTTTLGEVDILLSALDKCTEAEANPVGTLYMPYSGLLTVRQPNWVFTVKGFSKYIWDYESSDTENLLGRYLSYGHIEYNDLVNGYGSYQITKEDAAGTSDWDWRFLTGTTTRYISDANLSYAAVSKHRNFSDLPFLGGIGLDDQTAMFTNQMHDNQITGTFYADKSLFVAGNEILCLGSNVYDTKTTTLFATTLFQHKKNERNVYLNDTIVQKTTTGKNLPLVEDNFGNYYFVDQGKVDVRIKTGTVTAFINHGSSINPATTYAYTWLIQPTAEQLSVVKKQRPWSILKQDKQAHVAFHKTENVLAASIFEVKSPLNIHEIYQVNKPLMVMTRKSDNGNLSLALTNPDMDRLSANSNDDITKAIESTPGTVSEIYAELNGLYEIVQADTAVSISYQNERTRITVAHSFDSQTYRAVLKPQTTALKTVQDNDLYCYRNGENWQIESAQPDTIVWSCHSLLGALLKTGTTSSFNLSEFKSQPLILRVRDKQNNKSFKINN